MLAYASKIIVLACLSILCRCSNGNFNDFRDHYLAVFGVSPTALMQGHGGYIGKVFLQDGHEASKSQVYFGQERAAVTTNHRGGFYLDNLKPGPHSLYITHSSGMGTVQEFIIEADRVLENNNIQLQPLIHLSGQVITDEVTQAESIVGVDGSPFETQTDSNGFFNLEIPAGDHQIFAKNFAYLPYLSPPLALTYSQDLKIALQLRPLPSAEGSLVDAIQNFVVTGSRARFKFQVSSGIIGMQILSQMGSQVYRGDLQPKKLLPFSQDVEVEHAKEGYQYLEFIFSDAFGRSSQPIRFNYYVSLKDKEWSYIIGDVKQPLTIKSHEKVKFLSRHNFARPLPGEVIIERGPLLGAPIERENSSFRYPGDSVSSGPVTIDSSPTFFKPVIIEAGAEISGPGSFQGGLYIKGKKQLPVVWDLNDFIVTLAGDHVQIEHGHISNGLLETAYETLVSVSDSHFSHINLQTYTDLETLKRWHHNHFQQVVLSINCITAVPGRDDAEVPTEPSPASLNFETKLSLKHNLMENVFLVEYCQNIHETATVRINENNIFGKLSEYVFQISDLSQSPLNAANNYFDQPGSSIVENSAIPALFLPIASEPHRNVGIR